MINITFFTSCTFRNKNTLRTTIVNNCFHKIYINKVSWLLEHLIYHLIVYKKLNVRTNMAIKVYLYKLNELVCRIYDVASYTK